MGRVRGGGQEMGSGIGRFRGEGTIVDTTEFIGEGVSAGRTEGVPGVVRATAIEAFGGRGAGLSLMSASRTVRTNDR